MAYPLPERMLEGVEIRSEAKFGLGQKRFEEVGDT